MEVPTPRSLDPWATSSLLQKAIRRGEVDLACHAARELHRYRGKGVFRRLLNVVFEDVGIADPGLVAETAFVALNPSVRETLGSDWAIIEDLTRRLAGAPKDRSTDYLVCTAIKSAEGLAEQTRLEGRHSIELIEIASHPETNLLTRAAAVILACTHEDKMMKEPVGQLLARIERHAPGPIHQAVELAAKHRLGSYIAMLPLLWSALSQFAPPKVASDRVPPTTLIGGLPSYTFDKHTSAGKRAITSFAGQNPDMVRALEQVPADRRRDVALMAAFYADGVPISRRLAWSHSEELERLGFAADMGKAGCPREAMFPVLDCVRANLSDLDQARLSALGQDGSR